MRSVNGALAGLSRSGDGFFIAGWGTSGSEATLPSLDLGKSTKLLDAEWMLFFESPQLTTVVDGDKTYEGAGEFDLHWEAPPKELCWNSRTLDAPPSSSFFATRFSLEFIFIGASLVMFSVLLLLMDDLITQAPIARRTRAPITILWTL